MYEVDPSQMTPDLSNALKLSWTGRTIGNLRANGESVLGVLRLLLTEGAAVGCLGAIIGILLVVIMNNTILSEGILMPPAPGLTRQFHVRIELTAPMAARSFLWGTFTAVIATGAAAARIARMRIADALRST